MKTVRETEDQLILSNVPWVLALALVAMTVVCASAALFRMQEDLLTGLAMLVGMLVFCGVFLVAFVRRTQLIFDRATDSITLRRRSFLGYSEDVFALSDLDKAVIQTSRSTKGSVTRRAALRFGSGPHTGSLPVTLVYTSGRSPQRAVDTMNTWLARNHDKSDV